MPFIFVSCQLVQIKLWALWRGTGCLCGTSGASVEESPVSECVYILKVVWSKLTSCETTKSINVYVDTDDHHAHTCFWPLPDLVWPDLTLPEGSDSLYLMLDTSMYTQADRRERSTTQQTSKFLKKWDNLESDVQNFGILSSEGLGVSGVPAYSQKHHSPIISWSGLKVSWSV